MSPSDFTPTEVIPTMLWIVLPLAISSPGPLLNGCYCITVQTVGLAGAGSGLAHKEAAGTPSGGLKPAGDDAESFSSLVCLNTGRVGDIRTTGTPDSIRGTEVIPLGKPSR